MSPRHVLDDILVLQQLVAHAHERVEPHVDLRLTGGADLVVVHLDRDADLFELEHHLGPEILVAVHRGDREVALLVARLVAKVGLLVAPAVPEPLLRVDIVEAMVMALAEPHVVENEELRFRSEIRRVRDSGAVQIRLGLLGDIAGVSRIGLARDRVLDVANDVQGRVLGERVLERGRRVGEQQHVAFLDLLEPADARAVEPDPFLEGVQVELLRGDGEVLPESRQIDEP